MRNLLIINGSPRGGRGASGTIVNDIVKFIDEDKISYRVCDGGGLENINEEMLKELPKADDILFVFPVYVNCLPSNTMYCLEYLEANKERLNIKKDAKVFTFINCGVYEATETEFSIEVVKNWAKKMNLNFVQGVGFGGGGALLGARKQEPGEGIKENMKPLIEVLVNAIATGQPGANKYETITISREEYQQTSEAGWRKLIKRNGLTEEDLDKRW